MYGCKSYWTHTKHQTRIRVRLHTLLLSLVLFGCQQTVSPAPVPNPAIEVLAPIAQLQLEWADTPEERQMGLMNRTSLPENTGMVFVFEQNRPHCFWMKNTLIPLDIGLDVHCANQAIQYALEVNQDWFSRHPIPLGTPILKIHN